MSKAIDWGWNDINDRLPPLEKIVAICTEDGNIHYGYYDFKCGVGYWYLMTTSKDGDFIWNDDKNVPPRLRAIGWAPLSLSKTCEMPCKWVAINQYLPPSGQQVLVYVSSGDICTAFHSNADYNWHFMMGHNSFVPTNEQYTSGKYVVLAWTELPAYPYKSQPMTRLEEDI